MRVLRPLLVMCSLLVAAMAAADHPSTLDHMLRQVKEANSREAALRAEREQGFLHAKADREQLLAEQRERVAGARARGAALKQQFETNERELQALEADLAASSGNLGELFGTVRQVANDLQALMHDSLVSAQLPGRADWFDTLATSRKLPDITELERLWLLMQQEISESGQVVSFASDVVGADGLTASRAVTRVGVFNAVSGGRFLSYLPDSGQLVELSRQPERRYRALADSLTQRSQGYAPMIIDPTRGALLGLLVVLLVGANMVRKEMDRRTITTVLTKPVGRGEYLLGKYLGMTLTLALTREKETGTLEGLVATPLTGPSTLPTDPAITLAVTPSATTTSGTSSAGMSCRQRMRGS